MTQKEGLEKMAKYCAYQERCQSEVRQKLFGSGLSQDEIENIICDLIDQNFLDEERFARTYVRSKFRQKGWGKIKIKQNLKQKQISDYCIKKGFEEINPEEYIEKLESIIDKKIDSLKHESEFKRNQKAARFALGKGYESNLVWDIIN